MEETTIKEETQQAPPQPEPKPAAQSAPETPQKDIVKELPTQDIKRLTAKKTWIQDLVAGSYVVGEGWNPNYVLVGDDQVSRVNVIGVVVTKSNTELMNYGFFTIEDGSGRITVRSFEDKDIGKDLNAGQIVNIIGRPREYGGEIYLTPEITRVITDTAWVELRKLELGEYVAKETQKEAPVITPATVEEEIVVDKASNPEQKVIDFIKEHDKGDGVNVEEVVQQINEAGEIIKRLQQQGDVFEVRPGRVKVL